MKNIIKELNDLKFKLEKNNEICNRVFKDTITKENDVVLLEEAISNIESVINKYNSTIK